MQARNAKGLCFYCEEPYSFGHKCKKAYIFMMVAGEEGEEKAEVTPVGNVLEASSPNETIIDMGISL